MLLSAKLVLVGSEKYTSQKSGKEYSRLVFAQGADTITMLSSDLSLLTAPLYKEYSCMLSFNTRYNRLDLESVKTV